MQLDYVKDFRDIVNDLAIYLNYQSRMGMGDVSPDQAKEMAEVIDALGKNLTVKRPSLSSVVPGTLEEVRQELGDCARCELSASRKNIVFGKGNPHASLVFVGEGPGGEEDRAGEPFVGEAGQLLTKIIEAIKLTREEVYICNVVKCRPPKNRDPKTEEIEACLPFLKKQLAVIKPRIICALGNCAARSLLATDEPISRIRGKVFEQYNAKIIPTYHPASLLRNPQWKRPVWEDMQLIQKLLEENK